MVRSLFSQPAARRILVIQGHPDPSPDRLCRALSAAYAEAARAAGHSVAEIDVATLSIPFLRSQHAYEHEPVPDNLLHAQQAVLEADHYVLVFPLWLGTMPAMLKAFLEQVMRPGVAFAYREKGFPELLLAGRTARVVVTMGMPALLFRWWYGAHGVRGLERNILNFVGIRPVRTTLFGGVGAADEAKRRSWLACMRDLGARAR